MAARKRKISLTDSWKAKISASVICDRLQKHVGGKLKMTPTQIKAAQILLGKVVPDLTRAEHTGKGGGPIKTEGTVKVSPDDAYMRMLNGD
jgi:hypothetical protein